MVKTASTGRDAASRAQNDPARVARESGLHYVSDESPGITRRRCGRGFSFIDPDGYTIKDKRKRERLTALAIPPAWSDVWICPSSNGHIQAIGRDDRGRKQYIYHPRWREVRDAHKFDHLADFADALPGIRERTDADLSLPGLSREKVLAGVVRLLEATLIRIGNSEYARVNQSFGLTTLRKRHAEVEGSRILFHFNGKGGQEHERYVSDRRLAVIVRECMDIPGYELFKYFDDEGERRDVGSGDVNDYLREITGQDFTAKDFRTWGGTLLAAQELAAYPIPESDREAKDNIKAAIEAVAERLGNTPAICRQSYVHPAVLDAYSDGTLARIFRECAETIVPATPHDLDCEEAAVLMLLQARPASDLGAGG